MSGQYRHRIYDTILVTEEGKVGIATTEISGTNTLTVNGTTQVTELKAEAILQTPPNENSNS